MTTIALQAAQAGIRTRVSRCLGEYRNHLDYLDEFSLAQFRLNSPDTEPQILPPALTACIARFFSVNAHGLRFYVHECSENLFLMDMLRVRTPEYRLATLANEHSTDFSERGDILRRVRGTTYLIATWVLPPRTFDE